jgi:hypothetical protein
MEMTSVYSWGTNLLRLVQSPPERTSAPVGSRSAAAPSGVALGLLTIVGVFGVRPKNPGAAVGS